MFFNKNLIVIALKTGQSVVKFDKHDLVLE